MSKCSLYSQNLWVQQPAALHLPVFYGTHASLKTMDPPVQLGMNMLSNVPNRQLSYRVVAIQTAHHCFLALNTCIHEALSPVRVAVFCRGMAKTPIPLRDSSNVTCPFACCPSPLPVSIPIDSAKKTGVQTPRDRFPRVSEILA